MLSVGIKSYGGKSDLHCFHYSPRLFNPPEMLAVEIGKK